MFICIEDKKSTENDATTKSSVIDAFDVKKAHPYRE